MIIFEAKIRAGPTDPYSRFNLPWLVALAIRLPNHCPLAGGENKKALTNFFARLEQTIRKGLEMEQP